MAETDDGSTPTPKWHGALTRRWRMTLARRRARVALGGLTLVALALALAWNDRVHLADRFLAGRLTALKLAARYRIERVSTDRLVIRDVSLGDPVRPDLTVERIEVLTGFGGTFPGVSGVTLVRPRLYGRITGGRLSLGSLDPLLFGGPSNAPLALPDLGLRLVDGRVALVTDAGPVGLGLAGEGNLRDRFAGRLALVGTDLNMAGCRVGAAHFAGRLTSDGGRPRLSGPLRIERLNCAPGGLALGWGELALDLLGDSSLDGGEGGLSLTTGPLSRPSGLAVAGLTGGAKAAWRRQALSADLRLTARGLDSHGARAGALALDGQVRAITRGRARVLEGKGKFGGEGLATGPALLAALSRARAASAGTLGEPLLAGLGTVLAREGHGGRLSGNWTLGGTQAAPELAVSDVALVGGSGARLLTASAGWKRTSGISGALGLDGGLPPFSARIGPDAGGGMVVTGTLAPWIARDGRRVTARVAVPRLVARIGTGRGDVSGWAEVSGALPGGTVDTLRLPLDAGWGGQGGLAIGRHCLPLGASRVSLGSLALEHPALTLCPGDGRAMLAGTGNGWRGGLRAPGLNLAGRLGERPLRITGGPVTLGLSGKAALGAKALTIELGSGEDRSRLVLESLGGTIGGRARGGRFAGLNLALASVPLDVVKAGGVWTLSGGALRLGEVGMEVHDRPPGDPAAADPANRPSPRFAPLVAHGASLTLAKGMIHAEAELREPKSDRAVARVSLSHDLGKGSGQADLAVPDVTFDKALQPDTLTPLALGVIANASGSVHGQGHIAWSGGKITSTGRFATDGLDFAAAFGPVKGVAGTITFTDLLGMVTAPAQTLKIAAINPGIEADDGVMTFELRPGHELALLGGHWPFLDGELELRPTVMRLGVSEVRRYELRVTGMNAAKFIQHLDLSNLAATGVFDGSLPLVFDQNGGRVDGGLLVSRPPGGSVSYVGALSYKDLSPMANYAFETLRALNFSEMRVGLNGSLAGEIITHVSMKGVGQGKGAKRNFITRQIAHLPIEFNVNVRAPFFQLMTSFRSLYDPSYVADPRSVGLLGPDGKPLPAGSGKLGGQPNSPQPNIQPSVSEPRP